MQTKKQQFNVVKHGDCLAELQKLDDKCVDLILIDPPQYRRMNGILWNHQERVSTKTLFW